ncbi:uncharacterized protein ARMOST_18341 [Armillaria ostoyae]|uniref:Uncharacterized protein n=1 Tax=Armillaria ostoyae TaxID=47428 RepID=A0A284S1L3_ARMOS|nr:uncharacterized protein ARMOST_18341 [Armillaria ostoyae]
MSTSTTGVLFAIKGACVHSTTSNSTAMQEIHGDYDSRDLEALTGVVANSRTKACRAGLQSACARLKIFVAVRNIDGYNNGLEILEAKRRELRMA